MRLYYTFGIINNPLREWQRAHEYVFLLFKKEIFRELDAECA